MKCLNIKKSVLSISTLGIYLTPGNDEEARSLMYCANKDTVTVCTENYCLRSVWIELSSSTRNYILYYHLQNAKRVVPIYNSR